MKSFLKNSLQIIVLLLFLPSNSQTAAKKNLDFPFYNPSDTLFSTFFSTLSSPHLSLIKSTFVDKK